MNNYPNISRMIIWLLRAQLNRTLDDAFFSDDSIGNISFVCFDLFIGSGNNNNNNSSNTTVGEVNGDYIKSKSINFKIVMKYVDNFNTVNEAHCIDLAASKRNRSRNHIINGLDANSAGLKLKQLVMISVCSLILGGVALAAAVLRLRYYCKRRRTHCKDDINAYQSSAVRSSFGEIGIENERRINISRQPNYPLLDIYPNVGFQQKSQNWEFSNNGYSNKKAERYDTSRDTSPPPQLQLQSQSQSQSQPQPQSQLPQLPQPPPPIPLQVAVRKSPVITTNAFPNNSEMKRNKSITGHRFGTSGATATGKKAGGPPRQSLTNKIDAVMQKHFQKTGVVPHHSNPVSYKQPKAILKNAESMELFKNPNSKFRVRASSHGWPLSDVRIKNARSCSERLNFYVK